LADEAGTCVRMDDHHEIAGQHVRGPPFPIDDADISPERQSRRLEIAKLADECRQKDGELSELRTRVKSAVSLRDKMDARLEGLKLECEALKQRAHELSFRGNQKSGVLENALSQTEQLKGLIQQLGSTESPTNVEFQRELGGGTSSHPRVSPFSSVSVRGRDIVATMPLSDGKSISVHDKPHVAVLGRQAVRSVEQCTHPQWTSKSSNRNTVVSPRQSPCRAPGSHVPTMRRVRFAERVPESPRLLQHAKPVTRGSVAQAGHLGSADEAIAKGTSMPAGVGSTSLLPAIAALRGEVDTVSAVAGTDPTRYRAQIVGAVRQRLATVRTPLEPDLGN
jgi:hypothetical protein